MEVKEFAYRAREALRVVAAEKITRNNYTMHEERLRQLFPEPAEYQRFIRKYIVESTNIRMDDFISADVNVDAFPIIPAQVDEAVSLDSFTVMMVKRGSATFVLDRQVFNLQEHEMCLMKPHVRASIYQWEETDFAICVAIRPSALEMVLGRCLRGNNLIRDFLIDDEISFLHLKLQAWEGAERAMEDIFAMCQKRGTLQAESDFWRNQLVELKVEGLFVSALCEHTMEVLEEDRNSQLMTQLLSVLQADLAGTSLHQVAVRLGYEDSFISRYIQRITGKTFTELLQRFRMYEAGRLLRETNDSVDAVMYAVGYTGKANFYKLFQAYYHTTPAQYRKQTK